jgi:hypothetical protein
MEVINTADATEAAKEFGEALADFEECGAVKRAQEAQKQYGKTAC